MRRFATVARVSGRPPNFQRLCHNGNVAPSYCNTPKVTVVNQLIEVQSASTSDHRQWCVGSGDEQWGRSIVARRVQVHRRPGYSTAKGAASATGLHCPCSHGTLVVHSLPGEGIGVTTAQTQLSVPRPPHRPHSRQPPAAHAQDPRRLKASSPLLRAPHPCRAWSAPVYPPLHLNPRGNEVNSVHLHAAAPLSTLRARPYVIATVRL